MWLLLCGALSSVASGCLSLCPNGLSTCLRVGGPLEDQGVLRFGIWHLYASFGAYGGKETIAVLRTWKVPWKIFFPCSTILCIFGLQLMSNLCLFLLPTFLFASLSNLVFSLYTPSVLRGTLRFF
jgi:hypothetical protein